ncbi:MAG: ATP-binding cassette domain-containing protein, partial [Planctomycetaceae bacterium]
GQRSKEAQGRRTRLERYKRTEAIEKPREHERITVRLRAGERTGDFVVTLSDLQAGYEAGKPLVSVDKLDIMRGQRVAIVGPNGCGKTTLLRTILGSLKSLGGKVRMGSNVKIGYLSQTHAELLPTMTPINALKQIEPAMPEESARNLLGSLQLTGLDAFKQICELSGGQRSRVVLARLILQRANVLFLDEPTNHLDINSQEVLQDVLSEFDGTVVFVSHDRYLVKALATHIWALEDGTITSLRGDWDRYVQWRDERLGLAGQSRAEAKVQAQQAKQDRKEDFAERRRKTNQIQKLQRRLADVEKTIHDTEEKVKDINAGIAIASEAGDVDKITKLGEDYTLADTKLQELFAEWETISTELEQAGAE